MVRKGERGRQIFGERPENADICPLKRSIAVSDLKEGEDFYFERGLMVLTAKYLLKRGYCCKNACRNCPYGFTKKKKEAKDRGPGKV